MDPFRGKREAGTGAESMSESTQEQPESAESLDALRRAMLEAHDAKARVEALLRLSRSGSDEAVRLLEKTRVDPETGEETREVVASFEALTADDLSALMLSGADLSSVLMRDPDKPGRAFRRENLSE